MSIRTITILKLLSKETKSYRLISSLIDSIAKDEKEAKEKAYMETLDQQRIIMRLTDGFEQEQVSA